MHFNYIISYKIIFFYYLLEYPGVNYVIIYYITIFLLFTISKFNDIIINSMPFI